MKFIVHEKQVKAKLGAEYDLAKYTEGVDYKRQKTGFGSRVMFRADIVGSSDALSDLSADYVHKNADHVVESTDMIALSVVDPSLVEHKQDKPPIMVAVTEVITRPALLDGAVRTAKVVKKHQNQRYVETDTLGKVFVGSKGNQVKLNHSIQVKDGVLYLG